jgi:hypothetical protein
MLLQDMTEPQLRDLMNDVARSIVDAGKRHGVDRLLFVALAFNDPEVAQYVANCDRVSIVQAMRECAMRLAAKDDIPR